MTNDPDEFIPTRWTLIGRLKNWDDQESWRQFFETYWKLIYGVALKSGLTHSEAQDVVQETIISVSKNMKDFKADPAHGSFKSWLLGMTRWRITDQIRKRSPQEKAGAYRSEASSSEAERSTAIEERVPDPNANVLDMIWDDEWEKNLLDAALEKIKPQVSAKHFQIFYLLVIKKWSALKVANGLGVKVDQIYLVKHRLLGPFKQAVKDLEEHIV